MNNFHYNIMNCSNVLFSIKSYYGDEILEASCKDTILCTWCLSKIPVDELICYDIITDEDEATIGYIGTSTYFCNGKCYESFMKRYDYKVTQKDIDDIVTRKVSIPLSETY